MSIVYANDPLEYCRGRNLQQSMLFGGAAFTGIDSLPCQAFLANKCARHWDATCDQLYRETNDDWPGSIPKVDTYGGHTPLSTLTGGDQILAQTVREKFRTRMLNEGTSQCQRRTEPFDYSRPDSPSISYYVGNHCIPEYMPPPPTVCDRDIVLNLLLDKPHIAPDVLANMVATLRKRNLLDRYIGTRFYSFFERAERGW
jgi:hypothetical protein